MHETWIGDKATVHPCNESPFDIGNTMNRFAFTGKEQGIWETTANGSKC